CCYSLLSLMLAQADRLIPICTRRYSIYSLCLFNCDNFLLPGRIFPSEFVEQAAPRKQPQVGQQRAARRVEFLRSGKIFEQCIFGTTRDQVLVADGREAAR